MTALIQNQETGVGLTLRKEVKHILLRQMERGVTLQRKLIRLKFSK